MLILAIETSCDETSAAVLHSDNSPQNSPGDFSARFSLLSDVVSSQVQIHSSWGGVVPNLAAREHLKNILPVIDQAIKDAGVSLKDIDLFCVTQGPGLIPALLIGTNTAKTLSYYYQKSLLGIHHIEGHIYANFFENKRKGNLNQFQFPILNLVVSGGHTQLILMKNHLEYQIIGQTQDDAAGEAFDKVAKILKLGYPGGPIVSQLAEEAEAIIKEKLNKKSGENSEKIPEFPRPMLKSDNLNFSFSGLKTAVLYFFQDLEKKALPKEEKQQWKKIICKSFQDAVVDVLSQKTLQAAKLYEPKTVLLSGGVAANQKLRQTLQENLRKFYPEIFFGSPEINFCGDNAAMIAAAGLARYKSKPNDKSLASNWKNLEAQSDLRLP
jgi:N6-L-threonylcarbamoyladenine synthase